MAQVDKLKLTLEQSPLLQALLDVAPDAVQAALQDEQYQANIVLFREGDAADRFYAILSGELRIQHDIASRPPMILRHCKPSDIVGELSLLDDEPRSATVVVTRDSRLISLSRDDFYELLANNPDVQLTLIKTLALRLRSSSQYLVATGRSMEYLSEKFRSFGKTVPTGKSSRIQSGLGLMIDDLYDMSNSIMDGLSLLSDELKDTSTDEAQSLLNVLNTKAENIVQNLGRVKELQYIETGEYQFEMSPLMVEPILKNLQSEFAPVVYSRELSIELLVATEIPEVSADRNLLYSAVYQLLDNAVRYSPDGGRILLELNHVFGRDIQISVSDQGPGINQDLREQVLEPFYRGPENEHAAIGLGLAFARAVAEAHNGHLWIEDKPEGYGATIIISLATEAADNLR